MGKMCENRYFEALRECGIKGKSGKFNENSLFGCITTLRTCCDCQPKAVEVSEQGLEMRIFDEKSMKIDEKSNLTK